MHPIETGYAYPDAVLNADQARQFAFALHRVLVLDQHRRLPVVAIGNQRVVGVEFFLNTVVLEDALDAQHLLHLVANRHLIFEQQGDVLAQVDGAIFLVGNYLGAEIIARPGVGFERHQAVAVDRRHGSPSFRNAVHVSFLCQIP